MRTVSIQSPKQSQRVDRVTDGGKQGRDIEVGIFTSCQMRLRQGTQAVRGFERQKVLRGGMVMGGIVRNFKALGDKAMTQTAGMSCLCTIFGWEGRNDHDFSCLCGRVIQIRFRDRRIEIGHNIHGQQETMIWLMTA